MQGDQKRFESLTKQWERAGALWKPAAQKSQEAIAAYQCRSDIPGSEFPRGRLECSLTPLRNH